VLSEKPLVDNEQIELSKDLRDKLTKNIGHISSLLFQDPDTLIFNNE